MAILVSIGKSTDMESYSAGSAACCQALEQIKSGEPDIVFCFASSRFNHSQLIQGIKSIIPNAPLVGCTTAGEITADGPETKSVIVLLLQSDKLHTAVGMGGKVSIAARSAGSKLARDVIQKTNDSFIRHALMIFSDGINGNGTDVIRGIQDITGTSFPIIGGSAGDDFLFQNTFQYYEAGVFQDSVVGVLFSGDIKIGIGARHGWYPLGKPQIVTDARHNIIKKLDGRPAAGIYEEYFGPRVAEMHKEPLVRMAIMYPLGMSIQGEAECIIRNVLRANEFGELVCAGEVPVSSEIRVMMGSKEAALKAARKAAQIALAGLKGLKAKVVFVFDSVSRKKLYGRNAAQEIEILKDVFGLAVPIFGFYTYGEQAPLGAEINLGQAFFHNETIVVFAIGE